MQSKARAHRILPTVLVVLTAVIVLFGVMRSDLKAAKPESAESVPPAKKFRYLCEEGNSFTLEFDPQEDCAILTWEGKPMKLHRIVSGSGEKFSNGKTSVWLKGNEAFIEMDGRIIIKNCRRQD